jgi:hypothetical protein
LQRLQLLPQLVRLARFALAQRVELLGKLPSLCGEFTLALDPFAHAGFGGVECLFRRALCLRRGSAVFADDHLDAAAGQASDLYAGLLLLGWFLGSPGPRKSRLSFLQCVMSSYIGALASWQSSAALATASWFLLL